MIACQAPSDSTPPARLSPVRHKTNGVPARCGRADAEQRPAATRPVRTAEYPPVSCSLSFGFLQCFKCPVLKFEEVGCTSQKKLQCAAVSVSMLQYLTTTAAVQCTAGQPRIAAQLTPAAPPPPPRTLYSCGPLHRPPYCSLIMPGGPLCRHTDQTTASHGQPQQLLRKGCANV